MSFLDPSTMKSLEGKFLKFQDGVTRELQLISHKSEEREWNGVKRVSHIITALCKETGDEKEFNANKSFMQELTRINSQLQENTVVLVTPHAKEYDIKGEKVSGFTFEIKVKETRPEDIPFG